MSRSRSCRRPVQGVEARVLVLARGHLAPVGGNEVHRNQAVARETELPLEPAGAAAQGQARHAGRGDPPASGREPVRLAGSIEVAPGSSAPDDSRASVGIDGHRVQVAHIDHEPVLDEAVAGDAVATASHGERQTLPACESERGDHVRGVRAPGDVCGPLVDHRVEDRPRIVVAGVAECEDGAPEALDAVFGHTPPRQLARSGPILSRADPARPSAGRRSSGRNRGSPASLAHPLGSGPLRAIHTQGARVRARGPRTCRTRSGRPTRNRARTSVRAARRCRA